MDKRIPTVVTFIDFRKAFDCVQYDHLLDKIYDLGFDIKISNWIKDYLRDRQQRVIVNNQTSSLLTIKQGVPQGSILGPLLYLIYANDIQKVIKKCGAFFHADDTVLYSTCCKMTQAVKNMQKNINGLSKWCRQYNILMNVSKTKYMVFGSKYTLAKVKDFQLKVNDKPLDRVLSYTYLGVTLDPSLTFEKHVKKT